MKIPQDALAVLAECTVEGKALTIKSGQLDRRLYQAVNNVLEMMGGKWNRRSKTHAFDEDPTDLLDTVVLTGEITDQKKEFQFFETPDALADRMVELADIGADDWVLEPSAGGGRIARAIRRNQKPCALIMVELDPRRIPELKNIPCEVLEGDFLSLWKDPPTLPFERIIMNPPFSRQQDIRHILHAWDLLAGGGILVAVCSTSAFFRTNGAALKFQEWFKANDGDALNLAPGTFKESGTMIAAKLIKVRKCN